MSPLNTSIKNVFIFRLHENDDLLVSIKNLASKNNITSGMFYLIGAVKVAKFAFFENGAYKNIEMNESMEILSCLGNIATNDGEIIIHAHISFGNSEGKAFGGHLIEGSIIAPLVKICLLLISFDVRF